MDKAALEIDFGAESDDSCLKSADGKHHPDINSLSIQADGDEFYIDINCGSCGRSGCCGKYDASQVAW